MFLCAEIQYKSCMGSDPKPIWFCGLWIRLAESNSPHTSSKTAAWKAGNHREREHSFRELGPRKENLCVQISSLVGVFSPGAEPVPWLVPWQTICLMYCQEGQGGTRAALGECDFWLSFSEWGPPRGWSFISPPNSIFWWERGWETRAAWEPRSLWESLRWESAGKHCDHVQLQAEELAEIAAPGPPQGDGAHAVLPQKDSLTLQMSSMYSRDCTSYPELCCNVLQQETINPLFFRLHWHPLAGPQQNPREGRGPQETWGKTFCRDPTHSICPYINSICLSFQPNQDMGSSCLI